MPVIFRLFRRKPLNRDQKASPGREKTTGGDSQSSLTMPVNSDLTTNLRAVREAFGASPDLVIRNFTITLKTGAMKKPLPAAVVWIDGLIDTALVDQHILRPLMFEAGQAYSRECVQRRDILQFIRERVVTLGNLETANGLNMVIQGFLQGKVGLFVDSYPEDSSATSRDGRPEILRSRQARLPSGGRGRGLWRISGLI